MLKNLGLPMGVLAVALAAGGCDDGGDGEGGGDTDGETGEEGMVFACGDLVDESDLAACSPNALDYEPGRDDEYGECVTDDGTYTLVDSTPSSIARVEAYEDVLSILAADSSPNGFTDARAKYSEDEGLESRLQRREDLHYPEIPMSDWDPGVDPDKQCTVPANVEAYSDRCAGPAKIAPIMNDAFAAGQNGEGEPAVHVARIEAAGLWFLYLSVYKEANTCFTGKAQDCDSSWAYYTGGSDRGGGIGFSADVRAASPDAHEAIWNGFSAFRCLRDLEPADDTPAVGDLGMEGQALLCSAQSQLTTALDYGMAQVVIKRLEAFRGLEGVEAEAAWAGLEILGPTLNRGGNERDAGSYATVESLWGSGQPTDGESVAAAISTIEAVFGCP